MEQMHISHVPVKPADLACGDDASHPSVGIVHRQARLAEPIGPIVARVAAPRPAGLAQKPQVETWNIAAPASVASAGVTATTFLRTCVSGRLPRRHTPRVRPIHCHCKSFISIDMAQGSYRGATRSREARHEIGSGMDQREASLR